MFRFVEGFYNPSWRRSSIGYLTPAALEDAHKPNRAQTGTAKRETRP